MKRCRRLAVHNQSQRKKTQARKGLQTVSEAHGHIQEELTEGRERNKQNCHLQGTRDPKKNPKRK